jgi:hypothetical protein
MSPFEVMKQSHAAISSVLDKLHILPEEEVQLRRDTFEQLKAHIELDTHLEQNFFYPQLSRKGELSKRIEDSFEERATLKRLLEEMTRTKKYGKEWDEKLVKLRRLFDRHVAAEEGELFIKARDVLSMDEWEDIGRRMDLEKANLLVEK